MQKMFVVMYRFYSSLKQDFMYRNIQIKAETRAEVYERLKEKYISKDYVESISEISDES